jgi:hypothetical protein
VRRHGPLDVLPPEVARAVPEQPYWFVIGGQAVRCLCPYRPSRDVDFGVVKAKDLKQLLSHLRERGTVELIERDRNTVHLTFDGIDVSVFVLKRLAAHVEDYALDTTGILATKTHALLDRGLRRDFFDLYVMLQIGSLGLLDCLAALREVYESDVNEGLVLRALAYFDDAEDESALPGEGPEDWETVKAFFSTAVAALLVPPQQKLAIQSRTVGLVRKRR